MMYESALYLPLIGSITAVLALLQIKKERDSVFIALFAFSVVIGVRGIFLYGYFNTPPDVIQHTIFRALDFFVMSFFIPLGLEMTKANILSRVNRLNQYVVTTLYLFSFLFPFFSGIMLFFVGIETIRFIIIAYGTAIFSVLFGIFYILIRSSPYKIERPEISLGTKFVSIGYGLIIISESVGAGILRLIDQTFLLIALGVPFVAAGCFIIRTITFAGIYAHLDVGFVLSYGGKNVEMTNLGGEAQEGNISAIGLNRAESVLSKAADLIEETMRTGQATFIPQVRIPELKSDALYRLDVIPHSVTNTGKVLSVLIIVKDVTATLQNFETEQLKNLITRLKEERDKALNLADVLRHDFANILQGIQVGVDVIAMEHSEDIEVIEDISIAQDGLRKATELIGVVRDLRQAEEEHKEAAIFNVSELIDYVLIRLRKERPNQKIRTGVKINPPDLEAFADNYLKQALFHLVKYCTPEEQKRVLLNIQAYLDDTTDRAIIEVISFENLADPTHRESLVHWRSEAARPGESLSIPFLKMIVERNEGLFQIENRIPDDPQAGTKFIIALPTSAKGYDRVNSNGILAGYL